MSSTRTLPNLSTVHGPVSMQFTRFARGGGLCVNLLKTGDESYRPAGAHAEGPSLGKQLARITFNFGAKAHELPQLAPNELGFKAWDNFADFVPALLQCGLFEDTGRRICVGHPTPVQIWRIKAPFSVDALLNLH